MPNRSADTVYQLIHSLQKSEKRNFKLYITRNSSNADLKIIQLFDALDKMTSYDEELLLKKVPAIKKQQLPNTKAHLYKELLASLRLLKNVQDIDIQLHEQLDYARILYNKGLYHQSLKILDKLKIHARAEHQVAFLVQVLALEKKIETLHITRSLEDRAETLSRETETVVAHLQNVTALSNLALRLYSWYIKNGHARNEHEEEAVKKFFKENLPEETARPDSFYIRLYLNQCYCWYSFIRQDFLMYYKYTRKWVELFSEYPEMLANEASHYIKGLHNLLNAHFDLRNFEGFDKTLRQFEKFAASPIANQHHNNAVQVFVYLHIARINRHFMSGTFEEGLQLVPHIEKKLEEYELFLDRHRILVFYYKIATLYFGSGDYATSIDYLNKIINWKVDLRNDLQCYARLLHLFAHYESGNIAILEYLIGTVTRFFSKMETLTPVEEEIFRFLKSSVNISDRKIQLEYEKLLQRIKQYEKNRFATRSFAYLDIISWLESKVTKRSMSEVIREKAARHKKRNLR
jgi:hypothetical protein